MVSIDSEPRGASVALSGESKPVGATPFYLRMQRVPSDHLVFDAAGEKVTVPVDCHVRWSLEILGNGVLTFLAPEVAIAGVLIDLATGAAFECPETVLATLPRRVSKENARYCRRYVIAPPEHIDSSYSERLAAMWRNQAINALYGCDDFIADSVAQDVFDVLGITYRDPLTINGLDAERLHYLGHETGATHVVVLNYEIAGDQIQFHPEVYDLHRGGSTDVPGFAFVQSGGRSLEVHVGSWLALWTFSAFPNSISYGYDHDTMGVTSRDPWKVENETDRTSRLSETISRISLTSVEHPQAYGTWDYGFGLYPSLDLFSRSETVSVRDESGNRRDHDVSMFLLAPLYRADITGHTVLGAFSADIGGGLSFGRMKVDQAPAAFATSFMMAIEFSYTAFVTQTLFFQASTTAYANLFRSADKYEGDLRPVTTFNSTEARVGYYFPALKRRIRGLRKAPVP